MQGCNHFGEERSFMSAITRRDALAIAGFGLPLVASRAAFGQPTAPKKFLVLSCDGGGIRGLLTAKIIERLQAEVPFLDKVELFAGTSTGGIIALGLADSMTPTSLVQLYRQRGPEIFNNSVPRPARPGSPGSLKDSITNLRHEFLNRIQVNPSELFHSKYPNEGLSAVLTEIFGARKMEQLKSGKPALVTALRLSSEDKGWAPLVLNSLKIHQTGGNTRLQDESTPTTKLVDAALCTSAAPLYFPPHECPGFGYCIDGGVFANCPASIALGIALGSNAAVFDDIRILSIGTGVQISGIDIRHSHPFDEPGDYGAIAWLAPMARGERQGSEKLTPAFPLMSALFDSSSASHNYVCMQALQTQYKRVQVRLSRPVSLDDTAAETLKYLEDAADSIPKSEWDMITRWLKDQVA
jgi:uncharacterized protein